MLGGVQIYSYVYIQAGVLRERSIYILLFCDDHLEGLNLFNQWIRSGSDIKKRDSRKSTKQVRRSKGLHKSIVFIIINSCYPLSHLAGTFPPSLPLVLPLSALALALSQSLPVFQSLSHSLTSILPFNLWSPRHFQA